MNEFINKYNNKQLSDLNIRNNSEIESLAYLMNNFDNFLEPLKENKRILNNGMELTTGSIFSSDKSFSNYYDLKIPYKSGLNLKIISSNRPFYPRRKLINDKTIEAMINGNFFFLADGYQKLPKTSIYGLSISNKTIYSLPIQKTNLLLINQSGIEIRSANAEGIIKINNNLLAWSGCKNASHKVENILYTSENCIIDHTNSGRILDEMSHITPKNKSKTDLLIDKNIEDKFFISDIKNYGGTDTFDSYFCLQINTCELNNIKVNDTVEILSIDGLNISDYTDAISIGPKVDHFSENSTYITETDRSLGSKDPFRDSRMARSIIYMDEDSNLHFTIFDGYPGSNKTKGLTPTEVSQIFKGINHKWAYHLDPGQSARLLIRQDEELLIYGNSHYMKRYKDGSVLWNYRNGRMIPNSIAIIKDSYGG